MTGITEKIPKKGGHSFSEALNHHVLAKSFLLWCVPVTRSSHQACTMYRLHYRLLIKLCDKKVIGYLLEYLHVAFLWHTRQCKNPTIMSLCCTHLNSTKGTDFLCLLFMYICLGLWCVVCSVHSTFFLFVQGKLNSVCCILYAVCSVLYIVQRALCSVQFSLGSFQCSVYSVQCAVCSVKCAIFCVVCSVQGAVCSLQCAVCSVYCVMCSVQCAVFSVQCGVFSFQCAAFSVQCEMCRDQCAVSCALCRPS